MQQKNIHICFYEIFYRSKIRKKSDTDTSICFFDYEQQTLIDLGQLYLNMSSKEGGMQQKNIHICFYEIFYRTKITKNSDTDTSICFFDFEQQRLIDLGQLYLNMSSKEGYAAEKYSHLFLRNTLPHKNRKKSDTDTSICFFLILNSKD